MLGGSLLQIVTQPGFPAQPPRELPPPMPFENFSSDQAFQELPEREIVRLLDPAGNLVASPFGRLEDALPLSAAGLQALQAQSEWWETDTVRGQRMLIYSRPIVADGQVQFILQVARPLTERDRSLQALGVTLVAASLVTLLAAFGIGWGFSGLMLKPVQRITQTAQTIGAERDLARRVDYTGPQDEVGQLATTFNAMLERLQDAYQRVAHALDMQRDFVADVSHELRTPLTPLRGNLGQLRRTPPIPAEEQADILSDMVDESDRLIRLVNDLLVLARAEAGRDFAKEPIEIFPVMDETLRQARLLEPGRNIMLQAPAGLTILGDRDAFKQVLLIGLDNALKHSAGDICVTAEHTGRQVEIRIQDSGAGIPPEKLERIFDRFYRGEDGSVPGFGLGLPIAKSLVETQGGTIRMESEPGQGSVLLLHFLQ
jgi:signal transduction histidine kinase